MIIENLRAKFHKSLLDDNVLSVNQLGVPSNADGTNRASVALAKGIVKHLIFSITKAGLMISEPEAQVKLSGQEAGNLFEHLVKRYLHDALQEINHLRSGRYHFGIGKPISEFEQYRHLQSLTDALKKHRDLKAALGDYVICPDITIGKYPIEESEINRHSSFIFGRSVAALTPVREINSPNLLLHTSISCKWTLRSDRAQNARTEGLNLIRNRMGHTPHIVCVTGEPTLTRIASLALGTGDIDCVYHFALNELIAAVRDLNNDTVTDLLQTMYEGKRLRDISDLPFDLMA